MDFSDILVIFKGILKNIADDDELFTDFAVVLKKAHDALINQGFTQEQAIQIITNLKLGK